MVEQSVVPKGNRIREQVGTEPSNCAKVTSVGEGKPPSKLRSSTEFICTRVSEAPDFLRQGQPVFSRKSPSCSVSLLLTVLRF